MKPDGVFVSNGPGNPEDVPCVIETVRALRGKYPIFGLGLGHQLIARSFGAATKRLPMGHHSSNHAVRCIETGRLEIVNQNNEFVVDAASLEDTGLTVTHVNVIGGDVAGIECAAQRIFSLQYLPGTTPAPVGAVNPYDKFVATMKEAKTHA